MADLADILVGMLDKPDTDTQISALKALHELVQQNKKLRAQVLHTSLLGHLPQLLQETGSEQSFHAIRLLQQLSCSFKTDEHISEASYAIPALIQILSIGDPVHRAAAAWCLSSLSAVSPHLTNEIVESGAISPLLQLLTSFDDKDCQQAALAAVLSLTDSSQSNRNALLEAGVLDLLIKLISRDLSIAASLSDGLPNFLTPPSPSPWSASPQNSYRQSSTTFPRSASDTSLASLLAASPRGSFHRTKVPPSGSPVRTPTAQSYSKLGDNRSTSLQGQLVQAVVRLQLRDEEQQDIAVQALIRLLPAIHCITATWTGGSILVGNATCMATPPLATVAGDTGAATDTTVGSSSMASSNADASVAACITHVLLVAPLAQMLSSSSTLFCCEAANMVGRLASSMLDVLVACSVLAPLHRLLSSTDSRCCLAAASALSTLTKPRQTTHPSSLPANTLDDQPDSSAKLPSGQKACMFGTDMMTHLHDPRMLKPPRLEIYPTIPDYSSFPSLPTSPSPPPSPLPALSTAFASPNTPNGALGLSSPFMSEASESRTATSGMHTPAALNTPVAPLRVIVDQQAQDEGPRSRSVALASGTANAFSTAGPTPAAVQAALVGSLEQLLSSEESVQMKEQAALSLMAGWASNHDQILSSVSTAAVVPQLARVLFHSESLECLQAGGKLLHCVAASKEARARSGNVSATATASGNSHRDEVSACVSNATNANSSNDTSNSSSSGGDMQALSEAASIGLSALASRNDAAVLGTLQATLPAVIRMLSCPDTLCRQQSLQALASIVTGDVRKAAAAAAAGAIGPLVRLLAAAQDSAAAHEQACAALATLVQMNTANAEAAMSAGAVPILAIMLGNQSPSIQDIAGRALVATLSVADQHRKDLAVSAGVLPSLVQLMNGAHPVCREHAAAVMTVLVSRAGPRQDAAIQAGALPPLVVMMRELLQQESERATTGLITAAKAIGNLAYGSRARQTAVVKEGSLPLLVHILGVPKEACQIQAARALQAIVHGRRSTQRAAASAGALEEILKLLGTSTDPEVVDAAAHALQAMSDSLCYFHGALYWANPLNLEPMKSTKLASPSPGTWIITVPHSCFAVVAKLKSEPHGRQLLIRYKYRSSSCNMGLHLSTRNRYCVESQDPVPQGLEGGVLSHTVGNLSPAKLHVKLTFFTDQPAVAGKCEVECLEQLSLVMDAGGVSQLIGCSPEPQCLYRCLNKLKYTDGSIKETTD